MSAGHAGVSDEEEEEEEERAFAGEDGRVSDWEEGGSGDEGGWPPAWSLFEARAFPEGPAAALAHDAAEHGFDLRALARRGGWGFYDAVRAVNFVRSEVAAGRRPREADFGAAGGGGGGGAAAGWRDDAHLAPFRPDDELLFSLEELLGLEDLQEGDEAGGAGGAGGAGDAGARVRQLESENAALMQQLEAARETLGALVAGGDEQEGGSEGERRRRRREKIDRGYFQSYSGFGIHREMLADNARTCSYRTGLEGSPSLLRGSAVLDVGCGTGVLSLFAARAGARKVYAVDGSAEIAEVARDNVERNGFAGAVEVIQGRMEGVALPEKVDVIVSEWMGYCLLYESMLQSVLHARDRFLKPGGAVLPDVATMWVAGIAPGALGLDFWRDVHGLDMSAVAEREERTSRGTSRVASVKPGDVVTTSQRFLRLDLCTCTEADLSFTADFDLTCPSRHRPAACSGLALWFDTEFSARFCGQPVNLTTSPFAQETHWVQTLLFLNETVFLQGEGGEAGAGAGPGAGAGESAASRAAVALGSARRPARGLRGSLQVTQGKQDHRALEVVLQYAPYSGEERGPAGVVRYEI